MSGKNRKLPTATKSAFGLDDFVDKSINIIKSFNSDGPRLPIDHG